jgi:hypothetical protein
VLGSARQWLGTPAFGTHAVGVAWRSRADRRAAAWFTHVWLNTATRHAPFAAWAGAGTGEGRPLLLRAHPLLDDGIVRGAVFGRHVAQATVERHQPLASLGPARLTLAAFVDAARHSNGLRPGAGQVDAGFGVRLQVPGDSALRLDVARGLVDGRMALSAGWQHPWPF